MSHEKFNITLVTYPWAHSRKTPGYHRQDQTYARLFSGLPRWGTNALVGKRASGLPRMEKGKHVDTMGSTGNASGTKQGEKTRGESDRKVKVPAWAEPVNPTAAQPSGNGAGRPLNRGKATHE